MQVRLLATTSATALLMATAASFAQEEITTDDIVTVSVDGTMIEVPVSLAAQACGLDEATIRANAFTEVMDAKEGGEETTGSPEPAETTEDMMSSDGAATTDTAASAAETADPESQPEGNATDQAAADVADEAATAAEVGGDTTGVADTATTADNSTDSDTADEAAETVDGLQENADAGATGLAVCEIDQATAEQLGFPAGG